MTVVPAWLPFALSSALFAALTATFGKIGVADINSNLATFIRTVVILIMIAAIVSARGEWRVDGGIDLRGGTFLVLSGIATGFSWLCYYRALQLAPVSLVAPVDKLSVVFAITLSVLFLGETLSLKVIIGGLLIVAGSVVLVLE